MTLKDSGFEERYFERKGEYINRLLEEAVPVAYLGLSFWCPWRDIWITCLAGDLPYDAEITLQNPRKTKTIKIEVTSTETDETTMRRQALSREGSVFMTDPVRREGRWIVSEPTMVDINEQRKRLLELAFTRFREKAEKEDNPQTAILVYVNSAPSLPYWYRAQLLEQIRKYLREQRPRLYGVYYCFEADQGVDGLRNNIHDLI